MRWIALALLLLTAASGCKTLEVKAVTLNVNLNVTVPVDKPR